MDVAPLLEAVLYLIVDLEIPTGLCNSSSIKVLLSGHCDLGKNLPDDIDFAECVDGRGEAQLLQRTSFAIVA